MSITTELMTTATSKLDTTIHNFTTLLFLHPSTSKFHW